MRKQSIVVAMFGLAMLGSRLFAAVPQSYDFALGYDTNPKNDMSAKTIVLKDTLSFDYWYDGIQAGNSAKLTVYSQDAEYIELNNKAYGGGTTQYTVVSEVQNSGSWQTKTVEVPFWSLVNPDGTRRTDTHPLTFEISSPGNFSTVYIKNVKSYDTGRDIGYPVKGSNDQPVPEPGTVMMLGTSMLGLIGFEIRRRKHSA